MQKEMSKSLPEGKRWEIVHLHQGGHTAHQIAAKVRVTPQTVYKWINRYKQTRNVSEKPRTGRTRTTTIKQDEKIVKTMLRHAHDTL